MTNEEITADIIAACEAAKKEGFRIVDGQCGFLWPEKCACALSAVAWRQYGEKAVFAAYERENFSWDSLGKAVLELYGWSVDDMDLFIAGFDGGRDIGLPIYQIGKTVRAAVLP